jgi:hypothetical protein
MSTTTITLRVTYAWWLRPYLNTVIALCGLFNAEPNMDRVSHWIGKGIKLKAC